MTPFALSVKTALIFFQCRVNPQHATTFFERFGLCNLFAFFFQCRVPITPPHDNQYDKHYDKQSHVRRALEVGQHDKHYDNQYDTYGHKKSPD